MSNLGTRKERIAFYDANSPGSLLGGLRLAPGVQCSPCHWESKLYGCGAGMSSSTDVFSVRFRGQDWSGLEVRLLAPQPRRCRAICGVKLEHGCYWTREHWNKILKHDATASFHFPCCFRFDFPLSVCIYIYIYIHVHMYFLHIPDMPVLRALAHGLT